MISQYIIIAIFFHHCSWIDLIDTVISPCDAFEAEKKIQWEIKLHPHPPVHYAYYAY